MRRNELRTGNWFFNPNLIEDQFIFDQYNWFDWDLCSPILITEEWLLKFGFKQYVDFGQETGFYDLMPLQGFSYNISSKRIMIMQRGNTVSHWLEKPINYVHELQNLYFALTGQELEIK